MGYQCSCSVFLRGFAALRERRWICCAMNKITKETHDLIKPIADFTPELFDLLFDLIFDCVDTIVNFLRINSGAHRHNHQHIEMAAKQRARRP